MRRVCVLDSEPNNSGRLRGARVHNFKNVNVDIPRNALVVFIGISGSGKSSLAFGTLYAEAQRRYFESVSPYARRLMDQIAVPDVDSIEGLPPAVALQQQRGATSSRSSMGSITTLSNLLRMLYSGVGDYPRAQPTLYAEDFSPNTPQGACPDCHGLGSIYDVTEAAMVPDTSLSIREGAIAAWPRAWHGQNLRDILTTLGYDIDTPWRKLPKKDRDWILYSEEQPKNGAELPGHFYRRAQVCAADISQHPKCLDEKARGALHEFSDPSTMPWQTIETRGTVGHFRRPEHRCSFASAVE